MKKYIFLLILNLTSIISAMSQELKNISYTDGKTKHHAQAVFVQPNAPGVLILPAWMGIDEEARTAAKELSYQGYNVLIADIYGELDTPQTMEEAKKISSFYKENPELFRAKIKLAYESLTALGTDQSKIALIGYCFGGTGALEAARGNMPFTGVVSIHGGLKKTDTAYHTIGPKVLVEHPSEDDSVSKQDIDLFMNEMQKGKADWQFIYYANSKHTFTNPQSKDYNPIMAQRAWQHTLIFLREILK